MTNDHTKALQRAAIAAVRDCADEMEAGAASLLETLPTLPMDEGLRATAIELSTGLRDASGRVTFELALLQAELSEAKTDAATAVERLTGMDATLMGALAAMTDVADRLEGDAERDSREMLAVAQRHLGAQHALAIDAQWSLIAALQLQKKADEALALARVAYPALLARHGGNLRVPAVIEAGEKYGRVLALAGDRPAALKQLTQVVDDAAAVFGAESLAVGFFAANLANLQIDDGDVQAGLVNIERSLKALARELKVPVIALSQLSRAVESRTDKRPLLSDLRESGSIEQDADLVFFVYRDEYYNPESSEAQGLAELILAKHRNGPTDVVKLSFLKRYAKFADLAAG